VIAVDTNLLVYAHRSATPQHAGARKALERAAQSPLGWGFPLPVVAEFWSVVTHPQASRRPSTPEEARQFIRALTSVGAQIWTAGPGFAERLMEMATRLGVSGVRMFDLQISLMAGEGGARQFWTHDARFMAIPGMKIHDPLTSSHQITYL